MPDNDKSSKTEPATPKRRQEARAKGQVARSNDLSAVLILMGVVLFFRYYLPNMIKFFSDMFILVLSNLGDDFTDGGLSAYTLPLVIGIMKVLGPVLLVVVLLAIGVNILQVGILFSGQALTPKLERLNPIEGVKRLFSMRMIFLALVNVFKVSVVVYIVYKAIKSDLPYYALFMDMPVRQAMALAGMVLYRLSVKLIGALFVIAVVDYAYNKWEYERNLMMSKEEVKEEYKQMEGDPHVKARIKRIQRELARQRMMKDVETADVVITNPTHYAVALRYDPAKDSAPVLVAKGMRLIAEKIKEVASLNGVPIIENPPLARAIYKTVEVGESIPAKLYRAVAEVLAYVYKLKKKKVFS